ncbi:MAG: hypothetical protein PHP93_04955 [Kiritimatiellales bacterium]|nr:hypothetical protein [Kiritimatiellales bacterium]
MKRLAAKLPKYGEALVGAAVVVITVQYALITGVMNLNHPVSGLSQLFFYLLLAGAVSRGITQRSPLAWLVVQIMMVALFAFSLLLTGICVVLALKGWSFWTMLLTALLTAVVNGLLVGFLFTLASSNKTIPIRE